MAGETTLAIVGNLTADPELRTTQSGKQVCNVTVASTPRVFDKQTNQWTDGQALFLRCTAWGDFATHIASTMSKGMRVIAQGRLTQRSWQDEQGANHTVIEMQLDEIGQACATPPRRSPASAVSRATSRRADTPEARPSEPRCRPPARRLQPPTHGDSPPTEEPPSEPSALQETTWRRSPNSDDRNRHPDQ